MHISIITTLLLQAANPSQVMNNNKRAKQNQKTNKQ